MDHFGGGPRRGWRDRQDGRGCDGWPQSPQRSLRGAMSYTLAGCRARRGRSAAFSRLRRSPRRNVRAKSLRSAIAPA